MSASAPSYQRRIGLLGGSFNPAHAGHREISVAALNRLGLDAVWWLVSPGNPLKDAASYAPYETRLREARRIADHPAIVISDFERRHDLRYTVDTLERLSALNPQTRFVWLMGADSLATFHLWKDWRIIAQAAPFAVFNRPGYGDDARSAEAATELAAFELSPDDALTLADCEPPAWIFFTDTQNPLSSTDIRTRQCR